MSSLPFFEYSGKPRKTNVSGFSLIELLIVISLFALVAVIVTVSYISYESREQVKNAALQLVSDLRYAQNRARTGDKVSNNSSGCQTTNTTTTPPTITGNSLGGWYIKFDNTSASKIDEYEIGGVCVSSSGAESLIGSSRIVTFPKGVTIASFTYGTSVFNSGNSGKAHVFFRPVSLNVSFHNAYATDGHSSCTPPASGPYFTKTCSNLAGGGSELVVVLSSLDGGSYEVKVTSFGNIEHKKL